MASIGSSDADVVLIEFTDYECPFCRRHATGVMKEIETKYVAPGHLRYVFANTPLPTHQNARMLALAAMCAGEQGRYSHLHNRIFASKATSRLDVSSLLSDSGLDQQTFGVCFEGNPASEARIDADIELAKRLGLDSTPSFALGRQSTANSVTVHQLIIGAQPLDVFDGAITDLRR